MKKKLWYLICFSLWISTVAFPNPNSFSQIDELVADGKLKEAEKLLLEMLKTNFLDWQRAEVYWRLSRNSMLEGQQKIKEKLKVEEIIIYFEKGAVWAAEALKCNPSSAVAYFWRASNWASWCQVKKNLEAMGKIELIKKDLETAINLKSDFGFAYYSLGCLYAFLPGWPISFGNKVFAISLIRQGLNFIERKEETSIYFLTLSSFLKERNWDSSTRLKKRQEMLEKYKSTKELPIKSCFYEGFLDFNKPTVYSSKPLASLSDREEALLIIEYLENILPTLNLKTESLENTKKSIAKLKTELR